MSQKSGRWLLTGYYGPPGGGKLSQMSRRPARPRTGEWHDACGYYSPTYSGSQHCPNCEPELHAAEAAEFRRFQGRVMQAIGWSLALFLFLAMLSAVAR